MMILFSMIFTIPLIFILNYWFHFFVFALLTMMFMTKISMHFMFMNVSNMFGIDLLSFLMIMLSFWICMLILASSKIYKKNYNKNYFLMMNWVLMIILFMVFSSMNLFIFYLFFEFSLIPVLLMIMGWGYQPERIQAGVYLMFYTLFASLPMMISIFYFYNMSNSMDFLLKKKMKLKVLFFIYL